MVLKARFFGFKRKNPNLTATWTVLFSKELGRALIERLINLVDCDRDISILSSTTSSQACGYRHSFNYYNCNAVVVYYFILC